MPNIYDSESGRRVATATEQNVLEAAKAVAKKRGRPVFYFDAMGRWLVRPDGKIEVRSSSWD